mmetsp:Transcript_8998/g.25111  ORF Transcript_8998/g.25111 Transcript_8998/m.25111 type:complete len:117 (-) Transcript_8998:175-525(-)
MFSNRLGGQFPDAGLESQRRSRSLVNVTDLDRSLQTCAVCLVQALRIWCRHSHFQVPSDLHCDGTIRWYGSFCLSAFMLRSSWLLPPPCVYVYGPTLRAAVHPRQVLRGVPEVLGG